LAFITRATEAINTVATHVELVHAARFVAEHARDTKKAPKDASTIETACAHFVIENAMPNLL
jgi:hypothetical protein